MFEKVGQNASHDLLGLLGGGGRYSIPRVDRAEVKGHMQ